MATVAPTSPIALTSSRGQKGREQNEGTSSTSPPQLECAMPTSYEPVAGDPGPLTWRINYSKGHFRFMEYRTGSDEAENGGPGVYSMDWGAQKCVSEGGWGYADYFKMLALKTSDEAFALPPKCTELTVILDYRFVDKVRTVEVSSEATNLETCSECCSCQLQCGF